MPRHPALVPFSHDHHEALLVGLRLKKGGPSSSHDTLWPKEPRQQADALIRFAERELFAHFALEEATLFPVAVNISDESRETVRILLDEHSRIRGAIKLLPTAEASSLAETLRSFGELLEQHIRREERVLFPMIEQALGSGAIVLDEKTIRNRG